MLAEAASLRGVSLDVHCEDQPGVDRSWDALPRAGATRTPCGWIKDPFGLTRQIVPRRFSELVRDRDAKKVKAVMQAMLTMVRLDVAALDTRMTKRDRVNASGSTPHARAEEAP